MNKEESLEEDFEVLEFLEDSSDESMEEHEMNSEDEVDQVEGLDLVGEVVPLLGQQTLHVHHLGGLRLLALHLVTRE